MNGPDQNLWEGINTQPNPRAVLVVPEDHEAEKSFLATVAAMGSSPSAYAASSLLSDRDFVSPIHREVFLAICCLQRQGSEVNLITIQDELRRNGADGRVGGISGVIDILSFMEVERPEELASIIKSRTALRELIRLGSKIADDASSLRDPVEILAEASGVITALSSSTRTRQIITDMSDLLDDLAEGRAITTANGGRALSWGDEVLDRMCPIPRGEPVLIAARPGVGKSALALQIIVSSVEKQVGRPLFLSLEMGREKVKARLAAKLSGTNSRVFRDGQYTSDDIERITDRKRILSGMKVMFPNQQCPMEEIEALVRHAVDVYGIDSVVLDQFSHIHAPREARNETFAISNSMLSQRITALAKNLNLGWVTLGQINRDGEDSRRPNMKDLADTDRLAKDAAVIFGMWNKGTDDNQEVWGTIIKNRDDGHKGWAKKLTVDYGTCSFAVDEGFTDIPEIRGWRS